MSSGKRRPPGGPKIPFFPRSFWVQFSVARGTPPAIFGPSTPPPPYKLLYLDLNPNEICSKGPINWKPSMA